MKLTALAATALAAGCLAAQPATALASPAGSPGTVNLTQAPRLPQGAARTGAVPASAAQTATVVLKPRDPSALAGFVAAVTDRQSSQFHRYLARGQFAARFGPAPAAVSTVRSWLRGGGLRVTSVADGGLVMKVSASATLMERAFGTGIDRVRLAGGVAGQATTGAIRVPSRIADSVTAVLGLDSLARIHPLGLASTTTPTTRGKGVAGGVEAATGGGVAGTSGAQAACPDAHKAAQKFGGLTDTQIARSYGAFGLYGAGDLGAGQHIAVYELEPFAPSDVKTFDTCFFGAHTAAQMAKRLHVIPVDGGQPPGPGTGEAILDVEDISAMAPDATINVYEGPSPSADGTDYDPVDGYVSIVGADADQVVSTSWGLCEQAIQAGQPGLQQAENVLFQQAAAQGQTIFAAAGDDGSDDCDLSSASSPPRGQNPVSVDDPGSQPYVVSAGGLTIDAATQPPAEHVWNDGPQGGGGGGGISMSWQMPSWQRSSLVPGLVLPGDAYKQANAVEKRYGYPQNFCQAYLSGANSATPCRTVPDVSAQADEFTGAITVYSASFKSPQSPNGWTTEGGTSSAAPLWAGMLALVNASPTCAGNPVTKAGVGFVSPLLYSVASVPAAYHASFTDVTEGNNDTYDLADGQVFPATKGYDLSSGLGSPQLTAPGGKAGLAFYLCSYGGSASRPTVTGLTPSMLPVAGGQVHITGSGFTSGGHPDVARIQVGSWTVPAGQFTVHGGTSITATFPKAADTVPPGAPRPQDGAGPATVIVSLTSGGSSGPGPRSTLEYVDTHATATVPTVTGVVAYGGALHAPARETVLGAGFTGATKVTFGGVAAKSFTVHSPYEITAVPPPYSGRTQCAPLPKTGVYAGENAANDICQVQVQVTNAHGSSATGQIRPPLEGPIVINALGVLVAPAHCGCETEPVPTEYDYVPRPEITSVSTSAGDPGSLASEHGNSVITVTGKGLNPLTVEWANFGPANKEFSQNTGFVYETGTELQITAPAQATSVDPRGVPFSIRTLAGLSPVASVTYAGVPTVTGALNTALGHDGAADTGGAPMAITGRGFDQAVGPVRFAGPSGTSQSIYTVRSDTSMSTESVATNPGRFDVEVCSVTACSHNPPADYFYLYPPGNPVVTSVKPASGPAAGGTKVTIGGHNLGCVTGVSFGNVPAKTFSNPKALLYCGATGMVDAVAPPGKPGQKVTVTITTIESQFTGSGPSRSTAVFTYRR